jgi:uncharacterized protein YjbJ (UPF0337 family)
MNRNQIQGVAKEIRDAVREALGRITGNRSAQAAGTTEKFAGEVQRKAAILADAIRERVKN